MMKLQTTLDDHHSLTSAKAGDSVGTQTQRPVSRRISAVAAREVSLKATSGRKTTDIQMGVTVNKSSIQSSTIL